MVGVTMSEDIIEMKPNQLDRRVVSCTQPAQSLEVMLHALSRYGKPYLSHTGKGWHCSLEMYVGAQGVEFKIRTDFKHPTPSAAAEECCRRLDKVLVGMGV